MVYNPSKSCACVNKTVTFRPFPPQTQSIGVNRVSAPVSI